MSVKLLEYMGSDKSIVDAARVSYTNVKTISEDRALIRYLMRNWHTSPFEMVEFKFHIKVPIFVARQWVRHRTASINEISARYSVIDEEYWVPTEYRGQSSTNKQGSSGSVVGGDIQEKSCKDAFAIYKSLLALGVSRELARVHLPQSTYTEFVWKIDLHNLFHFLQLRMDHHAQKEISDPAKEIFDLIKKVVPLACEAFEDYRLNSLSLSGPDLKAIQTGDDSHLSKGEKEELKVKCKRIFPIRNEFIGDSPNV